MSQLTFEDATTTGHRHPRTSHDAALKVFPRSGTQRWRVYLALGYAGTDGLTDDEIADALRLPGNSVRPRRRELEQGGFIHRNGQTRLNAYGNECDVWICT